MADLRELGGGYQSPPAHLDLPNEGPSWRAGV